MPKTIEKTVYTFAELLETGSEKAKDNARHWLSEVATDHDWWDGTMPDRVH